MRAGSGATGYKKIAMFVNIVSGPTAIDVGGVSALGQALVYNEGEEARRSDKWREELA
jgi:hypothetical protein